MSDIYLHKRSATTTEIPLYTELQLGEIAVNTADGFAFMRTQSDEIVNLSKPTLTRVDQSGATLGQLIRWNGTAWVPYTVENTQSFRTTDVAIESSGDLQGVSSLSLTAGTWMVSFNCTFFSADVDLSQCKAGIYVSNACVISGGNASTIDEYISISGTTIITLAATTTIYLMATAGSEDIVVASAIELSPSNMIKCTGLIAVRLS